MYNNIVYIWAHFQLIITIYQILQANFSRPGKTFYFQAYGLGEVKMKSTKETGTPISLFVPVNEANSLMKKIQNIVLGAIALSHLSPETKSFRYLLGVFLNHLRHNIFYLQGLEAENHIL